ncbi:MAG: type II toxin-antitoxin system RelB/DinJ family antitoxin [Deltaproteobacteria bacterium]|nr:type II toxin-antitoxin system RelB/DinJ family antitoxin [Deltaproteobacteria bacterium]
MANIQIRIDEQLRDQAQAVAQGMGLDLTAAVRLFLTQMVRENGLPFQPKSDPFYSAGNQAHLAQVAKDLDNGACCSARGIIEE